MLCCVCLNEHKFLIYDGKCNEGICTDCFIKYDTEKCPNCRQIYPWIYIETCPVCVREFNRCFGTCVNFYENQSYKYRAYVCEVCTELYNNYHLAEYNPFGICTYCGSEDAEYGYLNIGYITVCDDCYPAVDTRINNAKKYFKKRVLHELQLRLQPAE